ncbi:hypothetical protein FAF44_02575 [Nonomuraea sp. MG754425]|uniref:hypothetical protein n=1 Tax=Nonomuraea sp. MG754425 TaxID=2570319 RepID=UPI001F1EBECE|nr:hypothetical protein [Nonomuraea sp. MG754425]MCF6467298.1 hypothetical protein [Nonomuraea sp. MG754425]
MSYFADDYGTDTEAIETLQRDADLEQTAMEREGNRLAALRAKGICTHSSGVMYRDPPVYPEQAGLRPGQTRCTEGTGGCTFVANSDEEWNATQDAL